MLANPWRIRFYFVLVHANESDDSRGFGIQTRRIEPHVGNALNPVWIAILPIGSRDIDSVLLSAL
jgi:hypothetical protein